MNSPFLYALVSIGLSATGQILLKNGVRLLSFDPELFLSLEGVLKIINNGWIPAGILCYFFGMISWLAALSRGELSQMYPLVSLNFAVLAVAGHIFFGENIGPARLLAILLIMAGVALIAKS